MVEVMIEKSLIEFLCETTGQDDISPATDLLESGLVDSLMMMDLIVFVETEFSTVLEFSDLTPETFQTPKTIAQLVSTRSAKIRANDAA